MTNPSEPRSPLPVTLLELWAERLHRNDLARERCLRRLADEGVEPREWPPRLRPADGERVVRLKEDLLALHREREAIRREIQLRGVELIAGPPLELLLPGGPGPGARLSWQPGEPAVTCWRDADDSPDDPRRPLETAANPLTEPPRH